MEVQAARDTGILNFEKAYLNLRQKEKRIFTDEEVEKLPTVDPSHPHYREWKIRQASCHRLKKYLAGKNRPLKILEIGCGNGWLSHEISLVPDSMVVGADINSFELEQARRVFSSATNLHFIFGDIGSPELTRQHYDIIVFASALQYFSSLSEIIKQAMELLSASGEIHIIDTHFYEEDELVAAKRRSEDYFMQSGYPELATHYFHHSLKELDNFSHQILYRPKRFIGLFQMNASPFYWVCITKKAGADYITSLPIVILMPHSACNCRCIMCDIWKDNKNLKQLTEDDIKILLTALRKLETRKVLMSGGEALLNPNFFRLCALLKPHGIAISLLSTGLTLEKHAEDLCHFVDDIIVSIDGDEIIHDSIRNIPGAFRKLARGVQAIKNRNPEFRISSRTVIQRQNFRNWTGIIDAAMAMGIDQVSFLAADTSSHAFNRELLWSDQRQQEVLLSREELPELKRILGEVIAISANHPGFVAESPEKLKKIYEHYAAYYKLNPYPYKKCNAPWVSAVVEADGKVRPCFFHESMGNIREQSLEDILNSKQSLRFRGELDINTNPTCVKCVCSLNLQPGTLL